MDLAPVGCIVKRPIELLLGYIQSHWKAGGYTCTVGFDLTWPLAFFCNQSMIKPESSIPVNALSLWAKAFMLVLQCGSSVAYHFSKHSSANHYIYSWDKDHLEILIIETECLLLEWKPVVILSFYRSAHLRLPPSPLAHPRVWWIERGGAIELGEDEITSLFI